MCPLYSCTTLAAAVLDTFWYRDVPGSVVASRLRDARCFVCLSGLVVLTASEVPPLMGLPNELSFRIPLGGELAQLVRVWVL